MAKLYDFHFVVRRADFTTTSDGIQMVTVPYGGASDIYAEQVSQLTYKDALARLKELSDCESRSHRAFLRMKYRDDRVPPGFKKAGNYIDGGS